MSLRWYCCLCDCDPQSLEHLACLFAYCDHRRCDTCPRAQGDDELVDASINFTPDDSTVRELAKLGSLILTGPDPFELAVIDSASLAKPDMYS